ncbi:hypothetical protein [Streptomyces formicae]|uniref:Uncharacterized protein n=1 Tax=Streptomyces formicae TaxID=1616117 RepID=A0ABY3WID7_9ACTN|nr:hypothetical protein [Streptomyces formicae]UNM12348.1 hypothetical protein J4032_13085 [Streptomyces formicae]
MTNDFGYGPYYGRVVVCLCKRHTWQQQVGEGGPGRECGHAQCGYPRPASACPWPLHVRWDDGNESHEGTATLWPAGDGRPDWSPGDPTADRPLMRPVPPLSGEGAIYSIEYLTRREGNAYGTEPYAPTAQRLIVN